MQHRPELWLDPAQGLTVEEYQQGRARPDGCLVPADAFVGQGEWADPSPVLMVVEVTSYDSDTDRRDRVDKPRAYAETGIPIYLLIDRDTREVKVRSRPDGGRYETVQTLPFGKEVALPEPVGITLDTEPLKNWVRRAGPTRPGPACGAARTVRRRCRRSGPTRRPRRTAAGTAASAGPGGPCR